MAQHVQMGLAGRCRPSVVGCIRPQRRPLSLWSQHPLSSGCRKTNHCMRATQTPDSGDDHVDDTDYAAVAAQLSKLMSKPKFTGEELRNIVVDKWGRSYDVRLMRRDGKMYLQVMWKFLEQQSFHLSEPEYMAQLDAVAEYITDWGVSDMVRASIASANPRGPGYTGGRGAKCISIQLPVDLSGGRSGEWS